MKRVIVTDNTVEFEDLLGKDIVVFSAVYIYAGKLVGVNKTHVVLENAHVVYETGAFTSPTWKDAQKLPVKEWKLRKVMVEGFGEVSR